MSLEFLIGRALANNLTNLMLDSRWAEFCTQCQIDPQDILEREPDAGLGNGKTRRASCA